MSYDWMNGEEVAHAFKTAEQQRAAQGRAAEGQYAGV